MSENNSLKLEKLRQQIENAAVAEAKRITDNAEKQAKSIIDEELERAKKEENTVTLAKTSKLENDERKRVSESRYAADRKVLLHRNAVVDGLFDDIKTELAEFTASDKYKKHLEKCAEKADSEQKLGDGVLAYCRKRDMEAAESVLAKYGIKPEFDRNILLGGLLFKYPDKGIFIDLTLDSVFESEREAFSSRSEMQL